MGYLETSHQVDGPRPLPSHMTSIHPDLLGDGAFVRTHQLPRML